MDKSIADLRKDYMMQSLLEQDVLSDPIAQFTNWWSEAVKSRIEEVNAMTLSTVNAEGAPSARIVLLKGLSGEGFTFFTNYDSNKGRQIAQNPRVALVFFWKELERQVRIEGLVEKVSEADSEAYFASRPLLSKLGAWASQQSIPIAGREILEQNVEKYKALFGEENIPKPPHWGGYLVKPVLMEFWQGRRSRLHDRILYSLKDGNWKIERLAP